MADGSPESDFEETAWWLELQQFAFADLWDNDEDSVYDCLIMIAETGESGRP